MLLTPKGLWRPRSLISKQTDEGLGKLNGQGRSANSEPILLPLIQDIKHHRPSIEMISHPPQISQTEVRLNRRKGQSQPLETALYMGSGECELHKSARQGTLLVLAFPYPPSSTTKQAFWCAYLYREGEISSLITFPHLRCFLPCLGRGETSS